MAPVSHTEKHLSTPTLKRPMDSQPEPTGIKVIVVGCGFAGLACAIESIRKGHTVVLFEKHENLDVYGDVISFAPNAGRIMERWGLHDQLMEICTQHPVVRVHNYLGELLVEQPLPQRCFGANSYNGRRGDILAVVLKCAKELGVDIRFGQRVTEYWEGDANAGVIVNDQRISADLVVGADGVRSLARSHVLGFDEKPQSSGYAIYRAWTNVQEHGIDQDPLTSFLCKDGGEFCSWLGEDAHMLAMSFRNSQYICWLLTHKDDYDIDESWSLPGKIDDALACVEGWDPRCAAIISHTPSCVDYKLVYRNPLPTWVSENGRVVLIGDAAHPFLPTSIQGASQGIEDSVTLATMLNLAGKMNVALATKVFERTRYERVRLAQLMGESTREKWHRRNAQDEDVKLPFPEWILDFDAEKHAHEVYDELAKDIVANGYRRPRTTAKKD